MAKMSGWTPPKKQKLHLFVCQDFPALAPTGVAAVMMANHSVHARRLLAQAIRAAGRAEDAKIAAKMSLTKFTNLKFAGAGCVILCDGDY